MGRPASSSKAASPPTRGIHARQRRRCESREIHSCCAVLAVRLPSHRAVVIVRCRCRVSSRCRLLVPSAALSGPASARRRQAVHSQRRERLRDARTAHSDHGCQRCRSDTATIEASARRDLGRSFTSLCLVPSLSRLCWLQARRLCSTFSVVAIRRPPLACPPARFCSTLAQWRTLR